MFDYIALILLNPVNYSKFFKKNNNFKIFLVALSFIYFALSVGFIAYIYSVMEDYSFSIGNFLIFVQIIVPHILLTYFLVDILKERKINSSLKIYKSLIQKCERQKLLQLEIKFYFRVSFIVFIHFFKLVWVTKFFNVCYVFAILVPEVVRCSVDFIFIFYVEILTEMVKNFKEEIKISSLTFKKLNNCKKLISKCSELGQSLSHVYSGKLLATITYNFISLIISFYWIFVRLAYNHLETAETFIYILQPIFNLFIVFYHCEMYFKEVGSETFYFYFSICYIHTANCLLNF
jgi:hypothetical protein